MEKTGHDFLARIGRRPLPVIGLVLWLVTFALYLPTLRNGFVDFDDPGYITGNIHVINGLSWPGIIWAFTSSELANWHPLTWISHMVDCQIFGQNPAGHHLIGALFHAVNTLLLFFLLQQMTRETWPSAFVAALFGWHPLHVESVAWAAERKDVLSTFFWLLTMMAYARYAKNPRVPTYLLAMFLFACALMSKPMSVTLPFVLLLADFWPLNRLAQPGFSVAGTDIPKENSRSLPVHRGIFLVFEKLPFFALAAAECGATFIAQKNGGAVFSDMALPVAYRLSNALWSYFRYVSNIFCPTDLSVIYPYKQHLPGALVIVSAVLLLAWSGLFFAWRNRFPYLLVGWLWFLGALVPAIGLVQVGMQSMADRYLYIPSIGLFIGIAWSLKDLWHHRPQLQKVILFAGAIALLMCLATTSKQIGYWRNSITLFTHAIEVTGDNSVAYNSLGIGYEKNGDRQAALMLYAKSVEIEPNYYPSQLNLGRMLLEDERYEEAFAHFDQAERLAGQNKGLESSLGKALFNAGKINEAVGHLQMAARLEPGNPQNHYYLGVALQKTSNTSEAIREFSTALRLQPDFLEAKKELDALLAAHPELK